MYVGMVVLATMVFQKSTFISINFCNSSGNHLTSQLSLGLQFNHIFDTFENAHANQLQVQA